MKLSIEKINKSFGNQIVLSEASYVLEKGKIYGLLGRNGAGKTTLFNCLTGNVKPDSGSATMETDDKAPHQVNYDDIGYVFAQPHLPEFMTGQEYIKYFISVNKNKMKNEVNLDEAFALIDFTVDDRQKLIKEYSYGMQNKLQILAFLLLQPPVIFLDEPLTSFDIVAAAQIKNLIKSLKQDHIIIFSTHILELAQELCDEIVILHKGKLSKLDPEKMHDKDFEENIVKILTEDSTDA